MLCTWSYGSIFCIDFSYTDRVRYNFARISSFSKFSIFRKFVFVFMSDFTAFAFVFVFKCRNRKQLRGFSTIFDRFHPYPPVPPILPRDDPPTHTLLGSRLHYHRAYLFSNLDVNIYDQIHFGIGPVSH